MALRAQNVVCAGQLHIVWVHGEGLFDGQSSVAITLATMTALRKAKPQLGLLEGVKVLHETLGVQISGQREHAVQGTLVG